MNKNRDGKDTQDSESRAWSVSEDADHLSRLPGLRRQRPFSTRFRQQRDLRPGLCRGRRIGHVVPRGGGVSVGVPTAADPPDLLPEVLRHVVEDEGVDAAVEGAER